MNSITLKSFFLLITVAVVALCLFHHRLAHADAKPVTLDPFLKDKLITITPVTGDSVKPYIDIIKDGERVEYDKEEKFNSNQYQGMVFPVVTEALSVGKVQLNEAKNIDPQRFMKPLVIIGDDDVSRNWLRKFSKVLTQRQAQVFVVNVASVERFKVLKALAPELYMHATNGDMFVQQLNLKHYPFYADKNGVLR